MSAPERAMDGLAACLRRNTQLAANPQSNPLRSVNSLKPVPPDPPRHGYLPPGTRFKPIPGPLGRRRPVGSRSQGEGTRIPARVVWILEEYSPVPQANSRLTASSQIFWLLRKCGGASFASLRMDSSSVLAAVFLPTLSMQSASLYLASTPGK